MPEKFPLTPFSEDHGIEAARQLNYYALRKRASGEKCATEVSMANIFGRGWR